MSNTVWSIGRKNANRCDILFEGDTISAVQASLNYLDGKFYLIDNISANGSYLIRNSKKIVLDKHTEVLPNDIIVFGANEFSFDDLLRVSSRSKGQNISVLTVKEGNKRIVSPNAPKKHKAKIIPNASKEVDTKRIRCMDCMKPIVSNAVCPSCSSGKHLKENR